MKKLISVDYDITPFWPQTIQMEQFLWLVTGKLFSIIEVPKIRPL